MVEQGIGYEISPIGEAAKNTLTSGQVPDTLVKSLQYVLPKVEESARLELLLFELWLHGGQTYHRFLLQLTDEQKISVQRTISSSLDNHNLDEPISEIEASMASHSRERLRRRKQRSKDLWKERADKILRGEIEPSIGNAERVAAFRRNASTVLVLDASGVKNPRQVAALMQKENQYVRYVRHRLIRAGLIQPIPREKNFELKHDEEKRLGREINQFILKGYENRDIARLVGCHETTVRRHRRKFHSKEKSTAA